MFFANGVIIVEGDAENLLIPAIAEVIGLPLDKYGVSIVNVGSKAWKRYVKIFERTDGKVMPVKVAVVSDGDVPYIEHLKENPPKVYQMKLDSDEVVIETEKRRFIELLKSKKQVTTDNPKKDYLNNQYVNHYIKLVKQRKDTNKYTPKQCNIQEFQNDWTLEYHLAQRCLKDDLLSAMKKAKEISDVGIDLPDDSSNAYEIMKPFLGNLSKALTAQCLANVLLEKGNTLKQDIENDTQLAYLVNAMICCNIIWG